MHLLCLVTLLPTIKQKINKTFWQTVKPLFSNIVKAKTVIKLVENDAMIDDEQYFVNIVKITRNNNMNKLGILQQTN